MAELSNNYQYAVGEKVFVYFDGLLYEAICLKRRKTDYGENQYYVHYKGFKSTWDEWSDEDDILPINQINISHKERLESNRKNCRRSKRGKKSQEPKETEDDSSRKPASRKRGRPKKNVDQSAEQAVGQSTVPAVGQSTVPAVGQSTVPAVGQSTVPTPAIGKSTVPAVEQSTVPAVEQSTVPAVGKSTVPAVGQSTVPAVGPSTVPAVGKSTVPAVGLSAESVVGQSDRENSAEPSVAQSTAPAFEQSAIPIVEDGPADRAVANIVLNIIPSSELLANKLRKLVIPFNLKNAVEFDCVIMHQHNYASQKLLKFPEKNFLAEVIYTFTNSSYFIDDSQKICSKMFCVTLMQYFNASVHKHLTYEVERIYCLKNKGMKCFINRLRNRPDINYIYKELIRPKAIWCYLYGPMYLLRLIVRLPTILISTSSLPQYDSDTFVHHIKQLIWFLKDNFDTYFTNNDYIQAEEMI
ncbi:unnamed protein product [Macrosiphum euphorbiae]|uniref:MRG domain-containing protein n=1 Tax=Macrosiphum euphorbiae TaxID=13131 RepID=A0AAV0WQH9_9HEMI|nr:unnamed protein product [Macrosiphum euphorbiae]